ncbi:MAG: hypothetical protein R3F33_06775 [Planctomycetota bacterium]
MQPDTELGPVESVTFGGVLEGRIERREDLEEAVKQLAALQLVRPDLEVRGGRFSLLFDGAPVQAGRLNTESSGQLIEALQGVLDTAAADPEPESSLRCTETYSKEIVESLFAVQEGKIAVLSRRRPRRPRDTQGAGAAGSETLTGLKSIPRAQLVFLCLLALAVGGLLTWRSGLIDRLLAADSASIQLEPGAFAQVLNVEVTSRFGGYRAQVTRGPGFPTSPQDLAEKERTSTSLAERAALAAAGEGRAVWLQVRAEDNEVLSQAQVELARLLEPEQSIEIKLDGHRRATKLAFSLQPEVKAP